MTLTHPTWVVVVVVVVVIFGAAESWRQEAGFLHFTGNFEFFLRLRRVGRRRWGSGGAAPGPRPKKLVREISPFLP